jgi:hypothetical protein
MQKLLLRRITLKASSIHEPVDLEHGPGALHSHATARARQFRAIEWCLFMS